MGKTMSLEAISVKLVELIKTRDEDKVRYWMNVLEKQRDPMVSVKLFILIRQQLRKIDGDLNTWFERVYFEDFHPEIKKMWLDFVDLCSLDINS
jgi:predicted NAD/FAD-binding protein